MLITSKSSDTIIEGHPALTGTLIGFVTLCSTYEESKEGLGITIKIMVFPLQILRCHLGGTISAQAAMREIKAGNKRTIQCKSCHKVSDLHESFSSPILDTIEPVAMETGVKSTHTGRQTRNEGEHNIFKATYKGC